MYRFETLRKHMKTFSKRLPYNATSFEMLRSSNRIYVDKTELVFNLADECGPYFLARPRRFGKSLLLSTFASLFSHGTEYFKDLYIEKYWQDKEDYIVITLNFAENYQNPKELDDTLFNVLLAAAKENNVDYSLISDPEYKSKEYIAPDFLKIVVNKSPKKVVLLIDEYDYPLCHSLHSEAEYERYRKYLEGFYNDVKDISGKLRFLFITGISRFSHVSLFSQLNNLDDLGKNAKYAALLGYTDDELHRYFDEYVENAAEILNTAKEALYRDLKQHYNGFRMNLDSEITVYNPWSVISFLKNPESGFRNYWYESGGLYPTLIVNYIKSIQKEPLSSFFKISIGSDTLTETYEFFTIPTPSLLFQTGYLTIRQEKRIGRSGHNLFLVPPNLEVRQALTRMYFSKIRKNPVPNSEIYTLANSLTEDFSNEYGEDLMEDFDIILNTFGYDNKVAFSDERNCRDFLYTAITMSGIYAAREIINTGGRADLVVEYAGKRYVFELKLARKNSDAERLLAEALTQVRECRYGEDISLPGKLIRFAVVISAEDKKVALWKRED